jgi:anthranilate phosphoribosyltransferase
MVVCGAVAIDGGIAQMDELSTLGETTVAEFYQERGFSTSTLSPDMFPLQAATIADLQGGDRDQNAGILCRILSGEERGAKRDAVLLNAAAGLFVAGHCNSLLEGWEAAAKLIDSGAAAAKLDSLTGAD